MVNLSAPWDQSLISRATFPLIGIWSCVIIVFFTLENDFIIILGIRFLSSITRCFIYDDISVFRNKLLLINQRNK